MTFRRISRTSRIAAALVVVALVAAACDPAEEIPAPTPAPTPDGAAPTQPPAPEPTSAPAQPSPVAAVPAADPVSFAIGLTVEPQATNPWGFATAYDVYVYGPTRASLFQVAYPGVVIAPYAAEGEPAEPVQTGDTWTVTQLLQDGFMWSDGSQLTAYDVAFTFEAVKSANIGGGWAEFFPYAESASPRLLDVVAVDALTVEYVFDSLPGLATWPHSVGTAWIMSESVWRPVLETALASEDAAATILGADVEDVAAGPMVFTTREGGSFLVNTANANYGDRGVAHTFYANGTYIQDGAVYSGPGPGDTVIAEYTEGPFVSDETFTLYGDQTAALLALQVGEIDYWLNPVGLGPQLQQEALGSDNLDVIVNPPNGFRYLAFNMRKSPGNFLAFRQAVAFMADKEFLTLQVLQGVALPVYTVVPEGNKKWYNAAVADAIKARYVGLTEQERLNIAYAALEAGGFTWEVPPVRDGAGDITTVGSGLIDPHGVPVPELEILAPPQAADPLRATAALWTENWLEKLGVRAKANPTGVNTIVAKVWPGVGNPPTFDLYILGWSLPDVFPTYHNLLFHSSQLAEVNDGANTPGYVSAEFDSIAEELLSSRDEAEVFDLVWQLEQKIADDLPYVILFDSPIIEVFSDDVIFPFTDTFSGLQKINAIPQAVRY